MKKFLSVLMAATMLVGVMALTGCGGDATEPTTDEANNQSEPASTTATDLKTVTEGVLTMSTNAAFPPYESTDDSGNVVGIDADIAAAIAEKLGLKLQIDDMDFDGALAARPERQERHRYGRRHRQRGAPAGFGFHRHLCQRCAGGYCPRGL